HCSPNRRGIAVAQHTAPSRRGRKPTPPTTVGQPRTASRFSPGAVTRKPEPHCRAGARERPNEEPARHLCSAGENHWQDYAVCGISELRRRQQFLALEG